MKNQEKLKSILDALTMEGLQNSDRALATALEELSASRGFRQK